MNRKAVLAMMAILAIVIVARLANQAPLVQLWPEQSTQPQPHNP